MHRFSRGAKKVIATNDVSPENKKAAPQTKRDDRIGGLSVFFYCGTVCPFEAYLVNPSGMKVGIDAETGRRFNEIPNSEYYGPCVGGCDADKVINIEWAESGDYLLVVSNRITKMATYKLVVNPYDNSGYALKMSIENIRTGLYSVSKFLFHADSANIKNCSLSGGFDGGGQRPKDVNKFLTYANPSDSQTDLPAGTRAFSLIIFYDLAIIPETFKARFNDMIISNLFRRNPGGWDIVTINLKDGDNLLALSVDGIGMDQIKTHSDDFLIVADLQERKNMPPQLHER